jgi:hypothetical protein
MDIPQHELYADLMSSHVFSRGYPIFHPASMKYLNLGVCGYFDDCGTWFPIVDIQNISKSETSATIKCNIPFSPLEEIAQDIPGISADWDPLCSKGVKSITLHANLQSPEYFAQII